MEEMLNILIQPLMNLIKPLLLKKEKKYFNIVLGTARYKQL